MTINEADLNAAADRLVQQNVHLCLSSMVAMMAQGYGPTQAGIAELFGTASDLCSPVLDYEEAARQAGWEQQEDGTWERDEDDDGEYAPPCDTAQDACEFDGLDAYEWEVFEHWAVSSWLAEKLAAEGERVDTDFAGLNVWGRTTTGQSISMDAVIRKIAADLLKAV